MSLPSTILAASEALDSKKITSGELVDNVLKKIDQWEPHLNAFLEVFNEEARAVAQKRDKQSDAGKTPLHGIPIAIKDLICTVTGRTTAASKILQRFKSTYQATVINRLEQAGAIIIGKTNLDEFAMGASNEYSAYGPVHNPWDFTRVSGGSSGGSVAAVAAGEAFAALGTDTGGSVRQPSAFCGTVGLKPTYGRISRFGVIAYASSFDQVGPITRTVKDNALMLEVLAGVDEYDATSSPEPVKKYTDYCGRDIKDMKIGLPQEYFGPDVDPSISQTVRAAADKLADLGAVLVDISLPLMYAAIPTYYLLVKAEASSNLARYDGLRYGALDIKTDNLLNHYLEARGRYFGPEVKRSILMGTYALSAGYVDAWYKQASRVRTLIRREFEQAFQQVDLIVGPVTPEVAFPIGSKTDDPLQMYLADLLTDPASVAGLPAMSVPCGFINKLPVGMQIIAPHFREEKIYQAAYAYEQANDWWQQIPALPEK